MYYNFIQLSNVFFEPFNGNLLLTFALRFCFWFWFWFYTGSWFYAGFLFWFCLLFFALLLILSSIHYSPSVGNIVILFLFDFLQLFFMLKFDFRLWKKSAWSSHLNDVFLMAHLVGNQLKMIHWTWWNLFSIWPALVVIFSWWGGKFCSSISSNELFLFRLRKFRFDLLDK